MSQPGFEGGAIDLVAGHEAAHLRHCCRCVLHTFAIPRWTRITTREASAASVPNMYTNLRLRYLLASCVIAFGVTAGATPALTAQSTAGQDLHQAGQDTKNAAKDTGNGVKKGSTKAYNATKHGTTKAADKTKEGTTKGYDKTKEGTEHVVNPKAQQSSKTKDAVKENDQKSHDAAKEDTQKAKDSTPQ